MSPQRMNMGLQFDDFLIRIKGLDPASKEYPVESSSRNGRFSSGSLRLNLDLLLATEVDTEAYGLALFEALFAGPVGEAFDLARGAAQVERRRLRIRLWIDDAAPEIQALPWERMHLPASAQPTPLACNEQFALSRFQGLDLPQPRPIEDRPLKMLAAISNPSDLPAGLSAIDVETELRVLGRSLSEILSDGLVELTIAAGRSGVPPNVRTILSAAGVRFDESPVTLRWLMENVPQHHLLHFVGHGFFRRAEPPKPGTAALYLETDDGRSQVVREEELVSGLAAAGQLPHLVFLAACESARQDASNPLVGLAPRLIRAGVPAVVAMQDRVPMETARLLTAHFYKNLLLYGAVDLAMNQARRLLYSREEPDWATPVLFSRLDDNTLIEPVAVEEPTRPPIPLPPAHYWANLAGLFVVAALLTFWYQRHLADYLFGSLLVGSALGIAVLGTAIRTVLTLGGEGVKSVVRRVLESRRTGYVVLGLAVACVGLLAATSSVYVTIDPREAADRSFQVRFVENGSPLREDETVNAERPIAGGPLFFHFRPGPVQLEVLDPPIFDPVSPRTRQVWSSIVFRVPHDLTMRRFRMIRLVPGSTLANNFARIEGPDSGRKYSLILTLNGETRVASEDLRKRRTFYVGESGPLIDARRGLSLEEDRAVLRRELKSFFGDDTEKIEEELPQWEKASESVVLDLRASDRLRVEIRRDDGIVLCRKEIALSAIDDGKTKTIMLERNQSDGQ